METLCGTCPLPPAVVQWSVLKTAICTVVCFLNREKSSSDLWARLGHIPSPQFAILLKHFASPDDAVGRTMTERCGMIHVNSFP